MGLFLFLFSFFSNTNFTEKTLAVSLIRTRFVGVKGEHADYGPYLKYWLKRLSVLLDILNVSLLQRFASKRFCSLNEKVLFIAAWDLIVD